MMSQNNQPHFKSLSNHFGTFCIKGLIEETFTVEILAEDIIAEFIFMILHQYCKIKFREYFLL